MTNSIYTGAFWRDTGERVLGTALAAAVAVLGGDAAFDVFHADWGVVGVVVGNAAAFTLVKALLAANLGAKGTAGFTTATIPVSPTGIGEFQHGGGQGSPAQVWDDYGQGDTALVAEETDTGGRHALRE